VDDAEEVGELFAAKTRDAMETYQTLLAKGVAPEVARAILPQSMYSEFIETGSLAAYARICHLRLDPHAQKEIREYATALSQLIQPVFPVSWAALRGKDQPQ
jgi:thymidylate synthase (FAD)